MKYSPPCSPRIHSRWHMHKLETNYYLDSGVSLGLGKKCRCHERMLNIFFVTMIVMIVLISGSHDYSSSSLSSHTHAFESSAFVAVGSLSPMQCHTSVSTWSLIITSTENSDNAKVRLTATTTLLFTQTLANLTTFAFYSNLTYVCFQRDGLSAADGH